MAEQDIVKKLWSLCDVLRDAGVNYSEYLNELVLLMFLKMVDEQIKAEILERDPLPQGCHWQDLLKLNGIELIHGYRQILTTLATGKNPDGTEIAGLSPKVRAIFTEAQSTIKEPKNLEYLIRSLDELDWFSHEKDELGNAYEGLLEKNANETKSGAGQYFTPRALINAMVRCVKPVPGEFIQDPAAGTGGFILAADRYIKEHTEELASLTFEEQEFQRLDAYEAVELVPNTRRLALMNCLLHNIEGRGEGVVKLGNSLGNVGESLKSADLILTNPPFGTAKGSGASLTRTDLPYKTTNKQLAFLEHIYRNLKPGGRAAVVFPDNVLFDSGVGRYIRTDLMDKCELHTILRLPTGIFYAAGVQANVLFFNKGRHDNPRQEHHCTDRIWVYDLRTNMPSFGKTTPFGEEHLKAFEQVFGDDPKGAAPRQEGDWAFTSPEDEKTEENSRWRCFSREWVKEHNDESLDITWLKDKDLEHDLESVDLHTVLSEAQEEASEIKRLMDELTGLLKGIR